MPTRAKRVVIALCAILVTALALVPLTAHAGKPGLKLVATLSRGSGPVAMHGDTIAVGSPEEEVVYLYTKRGNRWPRNPTVTIPRPSNLPQFLVGFGGSLALSDDTLAVGFASLRRVFAFARSGESWGVTPVADFIGEGYRGLSSAYGRSLAVAGGLLVIGGQWGAEFHRRTNGLWTPSDGISLEPDPLIDPIENQPGGPRNLRTIAFGAAVAVHGTTVLVGAPGYLANAPTEWAIPGWVHVYDATRLSHDDGSNQARIDICVDPAQDLHGLFGASVAAADGVTLVGAPGTAGGTGAGYLYYGPLGPDFTTSRPCFNAAPPLALFTFLGSTPPPALRAGTAVSLSPNRMFMFNSASVGPDGGFVHDGVLSNWKFTLEPVGPIPGGPHKAGWGDYVVSGPGLSVYRIKGD